MKKSFKNLKLYQKMLSVYVLIFGAFCIISISAMQFTLAIYDNKIYQKSLQELNYFTKTIELELKDVEKISYSIAMDYDIQRQLAYMMGLQDRGEYLLKMVEFRNRLLVEALNNDILTSITYTDRNITSFDVGKKYIKIPDPLYKRILERTKEAEGGYVSIEPSLDFPYLISGRNIREHIDSSLDYLGTLILTCNINTIINNNLEALESGQSSLCIFSDQEIIYRNNETLFKKLPKLKDTGGFRIININRKKYFMCYQKSDRSNWMYVNLFPYDSIYHLNTIVRYLMVLGFLILFILAFFVLKKLSRVITLPLEKLTVTMRIVEKGEFEQAKTYLGQEDTLDEIGLLNRDFQIMLDKIMLLIHENYEKQILLKDTQYKVLQSQINPHFLYNTLNSINWMVKAARKEDASKMIIALGNILHTALKKEPLITIMEDLELLKSYITIQQKRYDKRAEFIIQVKGNITDYYMPRMILQPLVENAIYHGVDNSLACCIISVSIREEEALILLQVEDNGPGIRPDELEKIRKFDIRCGSSGIGLNNIYKRLSFVFGEKFKFEINSRYGEGTKVSITIPKYRGENTV